MSAETKKRRRLNREANAALRRFQTLAEHWPEDKPHMTNTYIILQCPPLGGQMLLDFLAYHKIKPYMVVTGNDLPAGTSFIHIPPLPASSRATDEETIELEVGVTATLEMRPMIYPNDPFELPRRPRAFAPLTEAERGELERRAAREHAEWSAARADRKDPPE